MQLRDVIALSLSNIPGSFSIETVETGKHIVTTSIVTAEAITGYFEADIIFDVSKRTSIKCTAWSEYQILFTNIFFNYVLSSVLVLANIRRMTYADAAIFIKYLPDDSLLTGALK